MKHTIWKWAAAVLALILVLGAGGFFWYVNDYYHADKNALKAMEGTDTVAVTSAQDGWFFDGPGQEQALIFYPGAKVQPEAYAPVLDDLAASGLDCFLVKMPFNLAIFGKDRAQSILDEYEGFYSQWSIGGHSLGGAMAAGFAKDHLEELSGLVLLAAYPATDLKDSGLTVISIYGSEDEVLNRKKLQETKADLPASTEYVEIQGGNHAGFGDYGPQQGDGTASISPAQQQEETAELVIKALHVK